MGFADREGIDILPFRDMNKMNIKMEKKVNNMDRAIFQFESSKYNENEVIMLSRKACEHLANVDSCNVTKFDLESDSLEDLLNEDMFDTTNCYFRCFV